MRCLSYLAHVKAELLTDTIYDMKRSKLALHGEITAHRRTEHALREHRSRLERLVDEHTGELREANRRLEREIAEKTRLEAQFVQAQKMKAVGTLAGGIAHDFNNLLTGVVGGVEVALPELPADSSAAESPRIAREAAERAGELTAQLMSLSRREEPRMELVDPNAAVRQIAALLKSSLPERIALELDLDESIPRIEAAPGRLAQVLLNLAINARGSDVPVVLISSHASEGRRHSERVREQGFAGFLAKPLEARDLALSVRRILDAR